MQARDLVLGPWGHSFSLYYVQDPLHLVDVTFHCLVGGH